MRNSRYACFREMFLEAEKNNLDIREQRDIIKNLERLLSEDILSNDVAVLALILIDSGHRDC